MGKTQQTNDKRVKANRDYIVGTQIGVALRVKEPGDGEKVMCRKTTFIKNPYEISVKEKRYIFYSVTQVKWISFLLESKRNNDKNSWFG